MITLKQVQTEIAELMAEDDWTAKKKGRLSFLKLVVKYLETSPSEEFIMCDKRRIDRELEVINSRFDAWVSHNNQKGKTLQEQQKAFKKEYDIVHKKAQVKALSFILNKKYNEVVES